MVKDADPVLTKVMNDLKRVTDITRILDEQEKLNAPLPHYNKPMDAATDAAANATAAPATPAADAAATATPAAAPAPASDLPPELAPPAPAAAGAIQSKKGVNASK